MFTTNLTKGDRAQAMRHLRLPPSTQSHETSAMFVGGCIAFGISVVILASVLGATTLSFTYDRWVPVLIQVRERVGRASEQIERERVRVSLFSVPTE